MCESVQDALQEVGKARHGHYGAVDSTEGLETENLCAVVGDTGVEEGTVCDEDEHVDCTGKE